MINKYDNEVKNTCPFWLTIPLWASDEVMYVETL